jgi:hypothetical protein
MKAREGAPKGAQEAWKRSPKGAPGGQEMGSQMEPRGAREGEKRKGRQNQIMGAPKKASGGPRKWPQRRP